MIAFAMLSVVLPGSTALFFSSASDGRFFSSEVCTRAIELTLFFYNTTSNTNKLLTLATPFKPARSNVHVQVHSMKGMRGIYISYISHTIEAHMSSSAMVPENTENEAAVGSLAELFEGDRRIRDRMREHGCLILWVKPETMGVPSMSGIALNIEPLRLLAQWWCPQQKHAKSPSVTRLKQEARLWVFYHGNVMKTAHNIFV